MVERERRLAAAHGEVDVREDARIEQRAVQVAARVVHLVALAERVQAVALPGMQAPRERQRVEHAADVGDRPAGARERQLRVEEADVEFRIVDDELGALDEREELPRDVREARLRGQELAGDAVHGERRRLDLALGPQVALPGAAARPPVQELDAADLDDAVALGHLEARGFGVEDDLAHGA
jgi:hypothetical protein